MYNGRRKVDMRFLDRMVEYSQKQNIPVLGRCSIAPRETHTHCRCYKNKFIWY